MLKLSFLYVLGSVLWSFLFPNIFYSENQPETKVTSTVECLPPAMMETVVQPTKSGLWSDRTIWPNNTLPTTQNDVTIPSNITVTLTGTCRAKNLRISGQLKAINNSANNAWIDLIAQSIVIANNGLLEIGTEDKPYIANRNANGIRCQITLTGARNTNLGAGYKAILVQSGGKLELHGKKKKSWTNIARTVNKDVTRIPLKEAVDWEVGDVVAITATGLAQTGTSKRWEQVDQVTISAISADKKTIDISTPLKYRHIGGSKSYTRAADGKKWSADIYAEIGLLSHYIKIQGDTPNSDGFGGHIMIMKGATSHSENIELFKMGQKGVLGRYPYHWHLNEDKSRGSYLRNSSIHKSFNRAVTIHGTDYVTVDGVFAYDHIGHGIFLEDGAERFNTIKNNVVFVTRRPSNADRLTPSDNEFNTAQNRTPASYWITNPNNIFENNVAAGTEGTGFWIAIPHNGTPNQGKPMGESGNLAYYSGLNPVRQVLGKFEGFVAHTCMNGWDLFDQLKPNHSIDRNWGWIITQNQFISKGIFYGNDQAVYCGLDNGGDPSKVFFKDCVFSDNKRVTMLAANIQFEDCLMNTDTGLSVFNGTREFHWFYDGAGNYKDCHFEGWDSNSAEMIRQNVGAGATENFNATFSGITKGFSAPFKFSFLEVPDNDPRVRARRLGNVFKDLDGSLLGKPGTLIRDVAFLRDGHEFRHPSWKNAARSDYGFAGLWFSGVKGNIGVVRTKTGTDDACFFERPTDEAKGTYKFPMIVNEDFLYTYHFSEVPSGNKKMTLIWYRGEAGDLGYACFKGVGNLGSFRVSGASELTSRDAVRNATRNSYHIQSNGDVYVKFRAIGGDRRSNVTFQWNTNGSFAAGNLPCNRNVFEPGETTSVAENTPPNVSFTAPTENNFETGSNLGVVVNATDNESIANVQLFINNNLVRQEASAPYEWGTATTGQEDPQLLNLAAGEYILKAIATDNQGLTAEAVKTITVATTNAPPTVTITSPANGAEFTLGQEITFSTNASDPNGNLDKVNFFANNDLFKSVNSRPFETTFTPTTAGSYEIIARAIDTDNAKTDATITITVVEPAAQSLEYFKLRNVATGQYLTNSAANSQPITVSNDAQGNNKNWGIATSGNFSNIASQSDGVLRATGASFTEGAFAVVGTSKAAPTTDSDKIWTVIFDNTNDTYRFRAGDSNRFLYQNENGDIVTAEAVTTDTRSMWQLVPLNDASLSIFDLEKVATKIKIYPNPSVGKFTITFDQISTSTQKQIEIYSLNGKLIYKANTNSYKLTLDLPNLSSGLYMVKVNFDNNKVSYSKLIIK